MVELVHCFLPHTKMCRSAKTFVRVSSSTQNRPKIQPWVEFYHILQPDRPSYQNEPAQKADTGWNMAWHSKRCKYQKSKSKFNHRLYISPNSYYDVVFAT